MKRLEYILDKDHVTISRGDTITIPKGSHVVPIDERWVPKEILEQRNIFNATSEIFIYTKFGIVAVPKAIVRSI